MSDFPVFRPNVSTGRSDDFLGFHPVPRPPVPEATPDPTGDAFGDAKRYAVDTPFGGKGSMLLVDRSVCKYPCKVHDHGTGPVFQPQPDMDEVGVGWTVQHMPLDPSRSQVDKRCVLCWTLEADLTEHDCLVLAVVNG